MHLLTFVNRAGFFSTIGDMNHLIYKCGHEENPTILLHLFILYLLMTLTFKMLLCVQISLSHIYIKGVHVVLIVFAIQTRRLSVGVQQQNNGKII